MTHYDVRAQRWKHGWELHVDGVGVTQSRTLETAEQQVLDFVESLLGVDVSSDTVAVHADLGAIGTRLARARAKSERAQLLQREAAAASRASVHELREAGVSVSDIATLMQVSRGRVSQLLDVRDPAR